MAFDYKSIANWFDKHPNAAGTITGAAMTLGGGALAGRGQEKAAQLNLQAERERLAFDKLRGAGDLIGNPLQDQMRRNQMAMLRQLLLGNLSTSVTPPAHLAGVTGTVQGPRLTDAQMPFLQPGAMAAAEAPKWNLVNQMAPGTMTQAGLGAMGYGDAANQAAVGNAVAGGASGPLSPQDEFNSRFQEIAAAKQQTGDWEKAYQQVTGKAWPKGQNIKIDASGQSGTMVKDDPTWKKVARGALTVAPIAAAPFTGGASLAMIGGAAGALRGAMDGGVKGALMGGATGALGGALNAGAGKAAFSWGALGKQALSPQGIAAGIGAAAGDTTVGRVAGMAAPFLPGAQGLPQRGGASGPALASGATAANGYNNQTSIFGAGASAAPQSPGTAFSMLPVSGYVPGVGTVPTMPPPPKSAGRGSTARAVANAVGRGLSAPPQNAGVPGRLQQPDFDAAPAGARNPPLDYPWPGTAPAQPGRSAAAAAPAAPQNAGAPKRPFSYWDAAAQDWQRLRTDPRILKFFQQFGTGPVPTSAASRAAAPSSRYLGGR